MSTILGALAGLFVGFVAGAMTMGCLVRAASTQRERWPHRS